MPFLKPIIGKDNGITVISARPIPATVVNSPNCMSSPECGWFRVMARMVRDNNALNMRHHRLDLVATLHTTAVLA